YRCLESIRDYGCRQLEAAGEMEALRARHARHFGEVVLDREPGQTAAWIQRLRDVEADVRAALQWALAADAELALTLVESLHAFGLYSGRLGEARQWPDGAVAAVGGSPAARARALAVAAMAAYSQSDIAAGVAGADEAAALARQMGDDRTLARARRAEGL